MRHGRSIWCVTSYLIISPFVHHIWTRSRCFQKSSTYSDVDNLPYQRKKSPFSNKNGYGYQWTGLNVSYLVSLLCHSHTILIASRSACSSSPAAGEYCWPRLGAEGTGWSFYRHRDPADPWIPFKKRRKIIIWLRPCLNNTGWLLSRTKLYRMGFWFPYGCFFPLKIKERHGFKPSAVTTYDQILVEYPPGENRRKVKNAVISTKVILAQ